MEGAEHRTKASARAPKSYRGRVLVAANVFLSRGSEPNPRCTWKGPSRLGPEARQRHGARGSRGPRTGGGGGVTHDSWAKQSAAT